MTNKYDEIMQQLNARPKQTINGEPLYIPSEAQLDKMEADLGYPLPADYREFLKKYGGYGFDNAAMFLFKSGAHEQGQGAIDTFDGIGPVETMTQDDYYYSYLLELGVHWELLPDSGVRLVRSYSDDVGAIPWPKELLPISESPGGHTICLALGGLRPGAVFYWMTSGEVYLVANSFDEFINLLEIVPEE